MNNYSPPRRFPRLQTRVRGKLVHGQSSLTLTVLSLSEAGFYGEVPGLDNPPVSFKAVLHLDEVTPSWSPKASATPGDPVAWSGPVRLEVDAELLYVDLGRGSEDGETMTGLGARFVELDAASLETIRAFIATQGSRSREWRMVGGVPLPLADAKEPIRRA